MERALVTFLVSQREKHMASVCKLFILSGVICSLCGCASADSQIESTELQEQLPEETSNPMPNCSHDSRATQYELNECYGQIAQNSQTELDNLLSSLKEIYPENSWKTLQENQAEWELLREADCSWVRDFWEGGSLAPMQYHGCVNIKNLQRIEFIKAVACIDERWSNELAETCNSLKE